MIELKGREMGLFWNAWAYCEWMDWVVKNPERSSLSGEVQKAAIMSKAYCDVHGGKPFTVKEILALDVYELNQLLVAVRMQEEQDSTRTVEAEPANEGNAKSAAQ